MPPSLLFWITIALCGQLLLLLVTLIDFWKYKLKQFARLILDITTNDKIIQLNFSTN